jgi:hypothetical protein
MKYIKLFEEFDLDQFMENPEQYLDQTEEDSPEIEEGSCVTSYRGNGRVLSFDDKKEFAKVALFNSLKEIATVPFFSLKKVKCSEVNLPIEDVTQELKEISDKVIQYTEIVQPGFEEPDSVNSDAILNFIQDVLIDVLSMYKKDPKVTRHEGYSHLVNGIALLADLARNADPAIDDRVEAILQKFFEISA